MTSVAILQHAVGRHPSVEQARGLQRGFEAGAVGCGRAGAEVHQLPQRCACADGTYVGRAPVRGLRHGVFTLFKTRAFVAQGVAFLFQRMAIVLQCGLASRQTQACGLLGAVQRGAGRVIALQADGPGCQRFQCVGAIGAM